jgi:hypothetical protein
MARDAEKKAAAARQLRGTCVCSLSGHVSCVAHVCLSPKPDIGLITIAIKLLSVGYARALALGTDDRGRR